MPALRDALAARTGPAAPALTAPLPGGRVRCLACGHRCSVRPGGAGICKVRFHDGAGLRVPRGYVGALQVDPIEKKPFFHAFPGRDALTFGMLGCDLHCGYCQNWITSQVLRDDEAVAPPIHVTPERLVEAALENGAPVIASSYNEPLITADWAVEVFRAAKAAGLTCGFISNGNGTPEVLEYLRPWVDLYKVDLKSFRDDAYRQLGGHLRNVLDTVRRLKALEYWVEIVTLLIPGWNDSDAETREIAEFLAGIDRSIPWHVTAFHPDYKMTDRGRTPAETLLRACDIGKEAGLRFVYPGNIPGAVGTRENTCCHLCGALLIARRGFLVTENRMRGDSCPDCGGRIPGVWEKKPPRRTAGLGFPKPVEL